MPNHSSIVEEELLTEGSPKGFPLRSIVEDSRHIIQRCRCSICHIMREGNQSADILTKMEADQQDQLVVMEDPPDAVKSQAVADMVRVEYQRL